MSNEKLAIIVQSGECHHGILSPEQCIACLTEQVKDVKALTQAIQKEQGDRQRLIGRFEAVEHRLDRVERLLDANHRRRSP